MSIPATLEEAFEAIDKMLNEEDRRYIQEADDIDQVIAHIHHTFGRHLRNKWGLWGDGSPLKKCLREEHGILHPDDMSGFIIREYSRQRFKTRHQRLMED